MEFKEELDSLKKLWEEMKSTMEAATKNGQQESAEHKSKLEKMEKDIAGYEEKINDLQIKLNRPAEITAEEGSKEKEMSEKAKSVYFKFLTKGIRSLSPDEMKTMVLADDASLGYLAPAQFDNQVIKNVVEFSPIRQIATVRTITARSLNIPNRKTTLSASWIGETGLPTETTKTHGLLEVPVNKLGALAKVSSDSLDDINLLEQDLRDEFSEQFGVAEGTAFISGNGVKKPQGILSCSDITPLTSKTTNSIELDDLIKLEATLKEPYYANARFLMNRTTRRDLRLKKDSDGQYLWQPAIDASSPSTIFGYPYTLCTDLADVATAAQPLLFGDFRKGYLIVDRRGMTVQILDQLYAPEMGYLATKRVGGQVMLPEAIKILQIK